MWWKQCFFFFSSFSTETRLFDSFLRLSPKLGCQISFLYEIRNQQDKIHKIKCFECDGHNVFFSSQVFPQKHSFSTVFWGYLGNSAVKPPFPSQIWIQRAKIHKNKVFLMWWKQCFFFFSSFSTRTRLYDSFLRLSPKFGCQTSLSIRNLDSASQKKKIKCF